MIELDEVKERALTAPARHRPSRIWQAFGLQPHRAETFRLSSAPEGKAAKAFNHREDTRHHWALLIAA